MCKSVLVHLLDLTCNTQAHRNSDTGIKNHCCVIFFPPHFPSCPPEGRLQFNLLSAFSLFSVPPLAAECGPSCASSGSCLPRCVIGGWVGPLSNPPPQERRPARFHNFCEHDAGRYWTSENTSAAERALQHPPCWKTDTQIFELLRRSEPKGRDGRNSTKKKTTAQKDICVPLTASCILFGQTLTSPVPQGSPPSRASRHL